MWNKPELSNKTAPAVCTNKTWPTVQTKKHAMMPVSGSKISSPH